MPLLRSFTHITVYSHSGFLGAVTQWRAVAIGKEAGAITVIKNFQSYLFLFSLNYLTIWSLSRTSHRSCQTAFLTLTIVVTTSLNYLEKAILLLENRVRSPINEEEATKVAVQVITRVSSTETTAGDDSTATVDTYILQLDHGQKQTWRKMKTLKRIHQDPHQS